MNRLLLITAATAAIFLVRSLSGAAAPAPVDIGTGADAFDSGTTIRVSVDSAGDEGAGESTGPLISADGRFVAFSSDAANLVPDDGNEATDVFVRDTLMGTTQRVSMSSDGTEADDNSGATSISETGRFIAFTSRASNLTSDDTNDVCEYSTTPMFDDNCEDVFVHDMESGTTTRVSVSSQGTEGDGQSFGGSISRDGRYIAFTSGATNLVPWDQNNACDLTIRDELDNCWDVFVHDRQTGGTTRVSVSTTGVEANSYSSEAISSADGRFVAFSSVASNLVANDVGGVCSDTVPPEPFNCSDVFVHDRLTGVTTRASVSTSGEQADGPSSSPSIGGDGPLVAFFSLAGNLAANHKPGIFVHNLLSGQTDYVADGEMPMMSGGGRYIGFRSTRSDIVPGDANNQADVFVRDLKTGRTALASVSSDGEQGTSESQQPAFDSSGRAVAFYSQSENLSPGDSGDWRDAFVHVFDDSDSDGEWEPFDYCPLISNDIDTDVDMYPNACDNCPDDANPDQTNSDSDPEGDACDSDDDNDGLADAADNCDITVNTDQADVDGDSAGDLCDNCSDIPNVNQADQDSDTIGDACDSGPGDTNCNFVLDSIDALLVLRVVAGFAEPSYCINHYADIDCSGSISSQDALVILRRVAALPVQTLCGK